MQFRHPIINDNKSLIANILPGTQKDKFGTGNSPNDHLFIYICMYTNGYLRGRGRGSGTNIAQFICDEWRVAGTMASGIALRQAAVLTRRREMGPPQSNQFFSHINVPLIAPHLEREPAKGKCCTCISNN